MVEVQFTWSEGADQTLGAPCYETEGAAGADIRANLPPDMRATGMNLKAANRLLVPTGLRVAIPPGFEVQLRPRSGLALKHGITLLNAPGTIDSDYMIIRSGSARWRGLRAGRWRINSRQNRRKPC